MNQMLPKAIKTVCSKKHRERVNKVFGVIALIILSPFIIAVKSTNKFY
jgi:hypothetical protein